MKAFVLFCFLGAANTVYGFSSLSQQAAYYQDLYNNPTGPTQISKSQMTIGETRPKAVLKGVFYFGGSDRKRETLSSDYQELLCSEGFSQTYSVYSSVSKTVTCSEGEMNYNHIGTPKADGNRPYQLMQSLYNVIKAGGSLGPVYVHCYYGVHASNSFAQMALKQFCGISNEQAVDNWNKVNLYNSLDAENKAKQLEIVRSFRPYPEFAITAAERAVVCY
jgi:hypothetical protein